jgi:very-short-patch-repair endonuclease
VVGVRGNQNPPRDGEGDRAKRGGGGSRFTRRPETYTARKLRREMTLPEVLLWNRLRRSQLGAKFRNQHPIPPYVVDFYCVSARLVVEIDGLAHDSSERSERDARRDQALIEKGYDVLRLPASLILSDMEAALAAIAARVESPLRQPLRGCHLPASGEDLQ